eukprot:gene1770-12807_t
MGNCSTKEPTPATEVFRQAIEHFNKNEEANFMAKFANE